MNPEIITTINDGKLFIEFIRLILEIYRQECRLLLAVSHSKYNPEEYRNFQLASNIHIDTRLGPIYNSNWLFLLRIKSEAGR